MLAELVLMGLLCAQDAEKQPGPSEEEVSKWIEQLGHDDFDKREEAQKKLESMGAGILPQLEKALGATEDPEIRSRLKEIIRKLQNRVEGPKEQEGEGGEEGEIWRQFRMGRIQRIPVGRVQRPDPKKVLEAVKGILKEMDDVVKNEKMTDEEKVNRLRALATKLQQELYGQMLGRIEWRIGRHEPPKVERQDSSGKKIPTEKAQEKPEEKKDPYKEDRDREAEDESSRIERETIQELRRALERIFKELERRND